ncbi:hypothetical protein [Cellulosimicrobium sp. CUA-896]|uniref:hypothetical protein n=1 Tax=Cellulosimicrobium sp. CUA-896 TaxID=1517881 RepID=UPI0009FA913B|nr:hypothetical protein [Cellulosimicrobium sp. CUA-896]
MDADVTGLVPPAHAGAHLLVLPSTPGAARTPVDALARAWFAGAGWTTHPVASPAARPAGARFRGVVPGGESRPGELRLTEGARAVGPFPLTPARARALGVQGGVATAAFALHADDAPPRGGPAPVPDDRDGIVRAFPAGLPQGVELQLLGWAVAAARRVGGAVVADGRAVLTPDPDSGVELTLYSDHVLAPDDAAGVLRTVVPGARVVAVDPEGAPGAGPAGFLVAGDTPYDGGVRLAVRRAAQVPIALGDLDRTSTGRARTTCRGCRRTRTSSRSSGRRGCTSSPARGSGCSWHASPRCSTDARGRLVDDGGFVVRDRDLDERLTPTAPAPAFWV